MISCSKFIVDSLIVYTTKKKKRFNDLEKKLEPNPKNISLNKKKLFKVDNRGNNLFITLIYPYEIRAEDKIFINGNNNFNLLDFVSFVAIKNGMHSGDGFYFDNFSKRKIEENINIVKINEIILDFFYEKKI